MYLVFIGVSALAWAGECVQIRLAEDDAHAVERRGWTNGRPDVPETFDAGPLFGVIAADTPRAPDVAATARAITVATKEDVSVTVSAGRGQGCLAFGDMRPFRWAYDNAGLPTATFQVTVNGTLLATEEGWMLFSTSITDLRVTGLRTGDKVEVLVLGPGYATVSSCRGIPTMTAETVCDHGFLLWERRAYVY